MPSPPLAPDDGPIDFEHLRRMTLGDAGLEHEVLAMFSAQSAEPDRHARRLAAGCRRAGAYAEGFRARDRRLCRGRCRRPGWKPCSRAAPIRPSALAELGDAVALARTAIEAILRRS